MLPVDPFRDQATLRGDRVTLVPLTEAVIEDYLRMLGDPESLRLTGSHTGDTDPDAFRRGALKWLRGRVRAFDRADWAILRNHDRRFVGEVVLNEFDRANESMNFRIMLGPAEHFGHGHGYGTEATRLVIAHALHEIGLHRISLEVYAFNPRARHVYESCGFRAEGVLREALCWAGRWIDATVMSIVAGDPI